MKVIVKQIDEYKSSIHKGKTIPEYLIYLMKGETPIACFIEVGEKNKYDRCVSLFNTELNPSGESEGFTTITYQDFKASI